VTLRHPFVRAHLLVTLAATIVTAWFSYAYFHIDEYFQVVELTRFKLGQVEAWSLPWEHSARMRPWLQPWIYFLVARVGSVFFGVRDPFLATFAFRLVTGLACVGALALFLRTMLPWLDTDDERRFHVRVATLAGFLPYLFVRTSSETLSMALFTAGFALLLEGATRDASGRWTIVGVRRALDAGILLGLAFEARFQTAFLAIGLFAWLVVVARPPLGALARLGFGTGAALGFGALVDRWGYGEWSFPAWGYFRTNVLEGAAKLFGTDPPFSYFWTLPANVFAPIVVAFLLLAVLAWFRAPRHPLTWTTLPFFVIHNLVAHKEERFLFPLAILATGLVALAIAPSAARPMRASQWVWKRRRGFVAKLVAIESTLVMLLLAFYPLGWHHHVPFQRYVHEHMNDELRANALLDFDLGLPAFHPRVYEVDKAAPDEIVRRLEAGTARPWLVTDSPVLATGEPRLDEHATLVWSELPVYGDRAMTLRVMRVVDGYNAWARPPWKPSRFRSVYRLDAHPSK